MKINKLPAVLFALFFIFGSGMGNAVAIECSHPALSSASDALLTSDTVEASIVEVDSWDGKTPAEADDNIYYVFRPKNSTPETAFIFLPGGNSDPVAYAPTAHQIASNGYLTIIVPMPACVSMPTGQKRADKIISDFSEIDKWAIGGHSVGGVSACLYAAANAVIDGVIIWAVIPPISLVNTNLKVLIVYGTEDGRSTPEMVAATANLLPDDTVYEEIKGGNHTQFAYYDTSPDLYLEEDKAATITLEAQQEIIVNATSDFLHDMPDRPQTGGACPAAYLLGETDPRLDTLRRFRDNVLKKNSPGRKLIDFYYNNAGLIISMFDKHPLFKKSSKAVLELLIPAMAKMTDH